MSDADFDLDAFVDSLDLKPFSFTLGGKPRSLPHFESLSIQQALDIDRGQVERVLAEVSDDPELAELVVNLPGKASNALIERWEKAARVKPGESGASSRS